MRTRLKEREKKKIFLGWLGLALAIFFLTWRTLTAAIARLTQPRVPVTCRLTTKSYSFARMNFLVDQNPPTLISLSVENNEASLIVLPEKLFRHLLDENNKRKNCPEVVFAGIMSYFIGLPVDGYLILDNGPGRLPADRILSLKSARWLLHPLRSLKAVWQVTTDLSIKNIYYWWRWSANLRANRLNLINLEGERFFDAGSLTWHQEAADEVLGRQVFDPRIRAENLRVVIFNGSGIPGAASQLGRVVNNLGAELVSVNNLKLTDCQALAIRCPKGNLNDSLLLVSSERQSSETVKRLTGVIGKAPTVSDQLPEIGDIFLVVGEDSAGRGILGAVVHAQ